MKLSKEVYYRTKALAWEVVNCIDPAASIAEYDYEESVESVAKRIGTVVERIADEAEE